MAKRPKSLAPPPKEIAEAHWKGQERSLFRQPPSSRKRDPGLTIVNEPAEVVGIMEAEIAGGPVATFRARSTATTLPDPVARTQGLIRLKTVQGLTAAEWLAHVESSDDYQLYLVLYGNMSDSQRAAHISKYADRELRKQQEVLKQHHLQVAEEEKRKRHSLAAMKVMSGLWKKEPDEA